MKKTFKLQKYVGPSLDPTLVNTELWVLYRIHKILQFSTLAMAYSFVHDSSTEIYTEPSYYICNPTTKRYMEIPNPVLVLGFQWQVYYTNEL